MLPFPEIKPYLFKVGPIQVRWYGLMYLIGIVSSYYIVKRWVKKKELPVSDEVLGSLYFTLLVGLAVGARLGYVIFYHLAYYRENLLEIFAVWKGGMSFHGGLIGIIIAGVVFSRKRGIPGLALADLVAATAPIGLACGRIGNFINGELYGRVTDVPWAMVFPAAGELPRHPSQLYESFFEGPVLLAVLWVMRDRVRRNGTITALFLILYGGMRFLIEFFREPDPQLGFIAGPFTMGQLLSGAMIAGGLLFLALLGRRPG